MLVVRLLHRSCPLLLLAAFAGAPLAAAAGPWVEEEQARVRLVSSWAVAPAEGDPGLGLEFTLAPGWHVYWKNAGDAGYPPELVFAPGGPIASAELLFPAPERYDLAGGLVSFGYEEGVIYPVQGRLEPEHGAAVAALAAQIDYLVCAESCIPYRAQLALDLPLGEPRPDPEVAPRLAAWRARLPRPIDTPGAPRVSAGLVANDGAGLTLEVRVAGEGLRAVAPDLFFESHPRLYVERPALVATAAGPGFRVPLRPIDETRPLPDRLRFAWTLTGFEVGGEIAAWEGTVELPRPLPGAARGALPRSLVLIATLAAVGLLLYRFRVAATRRSSS
jgi:suppressor for copper-sensitivity B